MEGVWKIGTKAVDIAGISDQDKREKIAAKEPVSGAEVVKKPSPLREIFANRWVSLSNSGGGGWAANCAGAGASQ